MLLAVDIGNTSITYGLFDGEKLIDTFFQEGEVAPFDKLRVKQPRFLDDYKDRITSCLISSVVPEKNHEVVQSIKDYFKIEPKVLTYKDIDLKILVDNPEEVGIDRLVSAYYVYGKYKKNAIVVDLGTATTFDVVTKDGEYLGGAISLGLNISRDALARKTALLPKIEIEKPKNVIGKNTVSAMQSGIVYGIASIIDGIISKIKEEQKDIEMVIATGGQIDIIKDEVKSLDIIEKDLILRGLRNITCKKN